MADTFSKKERSRIMAAVKSTGNKVTENSLRAIFRRNQVSSPQLILQVIG